MKNRMAAILLVITFLITFISFTATPAATVKTYSPLPTISPSVISTSPMPVILDNSAESRLAKILTHRPTLSQQDSQSKSTMLTTILHGFNSGILFKNNDVQLEYVQSADLFMAEIKTTSILQAKAETGTWLKSQGLSQSGICNLPVMFYLDPVITQELQGQDVIFSPLAIGC
jgi:hypothetical protein